MMLFYFLFFSVVWLGPVIFGFVMMLGLLKRPERWGSYGLASFITAATAIGIIWLSIIYFRQYGVALFIGVPLYCGVLTPLMVARRGILSHGEAIGTVTLTLILIGPAIILTKIDGVVCVWMAMPLALAEAYTTAFIVNLVLRSRFRRASQLPLVLSCLALPFLVGFESRCDLPPPESTVTSTIEINASPEQIWKFIPSIPEIPGPLDLPFRIGIAYPVRSETHGSGIGATRQCILSTGPLKERITAWEPGRLLRFDVLSCPPSMEEISIYRDLKTVHLENFMVSEWGEFKLVPLDAHRTRLIGTSRYHNRMWPSAYWLTVSDWIVHRIHLRVLSFIKAEAEAENRAPLVSALDALPIRDR